MIDKAFQLYDFVPIFKFFSCSLYDKHGFCIGTFPGRAWSQPEKAEGGEDG
jgi:hypothetical protein